MKKIRCIAIMILCIITFIIGSAATALAHSGRTDGSGGHKDNKNKSGLGRYHYHCGGYPAHLHEDGYCPYTDVFPSKVSITADKVTLRLGEEVAISATVSPSNACDRSVYWECSDSDVIRLDDNTIKAVGYGTAIITATTFNGKVSTVKITVKEITAKEVTISGKADAEEKIYIGHSMQLEAKISPENVDNPTINWETSNADIATVDKNGCVKTFAAGSVTISAIASNGVTGKYKFNVAEKYVEKIEIIEDDIEMYIGSEQKIFAQILPEDATFPEVTWSSSNPNIVEISEEGILKAVACGTATITALSSNGLSDKLDIVVKEIRAEKIEIIGKESLVIGEKENFSIIFYPANTTNQIIEWLVSDSNIAEIDENGQLSAIQVGEVELIAKQKDVETSIIVQVEPIRVQKIEITASSEEKVQVGDLIELSAKVFPENATYPTIIWETSNEDIATIDENGYLETKSTGTVIITARTKDGYTENYEMEVFMSDTSVMLILSGTIVCGIGGFGIVRKKLKRSNR